MFFSVITKNLNRKTLTKNLVTIKRWDEVKDEKFKYYEGSLKNPNFRERVTKNQYIGGIAFKRGEGAWTVSRFRGGWLGEKQGGGVFEGAPMHAMHHPFSLFIFSKFYSLLSGFSLLGR